MKVTIVLALGAVLAGCVGAADEAEAPDVGAPAVQACHRAQTGTAPTHHAIASGMGIAPERMDSCAGPFPNDPTGFVGDDLTAKPAR